MAHLTAMAAEDGLELRFDRALRVNTFDAHRLLWLAGAAKGPSLQGALKERLMRAYFADGLDVSDHDTLVALAAECGMPPDDAGRLLGSDRGVTEVQSEIARAAELDVMGVPSFVFEQQLVVPGAQDVETFVRIIKRVAARRAG
jgi:predicted DsbA family dithiol-disulfide isomerase